jgi:hypothetical protein
MDEHVLANKIQKNTLKSIVLQSAFAANVIARGMAVEGWPYLIF